jgi:diguanylate cyclase (GGDEF)-like protein
MFRRSFRSRIIIPTVIVLFVLVVFLNVFLLIRFSALSDAHVSETLIANAHSFRDGVLIGLGGLIISIIILFFIISTNSKPIIDLSDDMNHIADGNLHIKIDVKTNDEIGYLSSSLQRIANTLRKLLHDINTMIVEQKNGNTDYCLNTGEFHGDYKKLADSVLDLAAFGMRDQLTGIPNRRSFDYRLKWEWNRAIRDKSPLSILMLDVDKFKNYNDTLGHQQGDVALQVIAKTIKQTVKRLTDFAARWGGEEFIVLLPTTNSAGAVCVAEKIRTGIENAEIPCSDPRGMKVTISIGVCTHIPTSLISPEHAISLADNALYKAKAAGRNRVVLVEEDDA